MSALGNLFSEIASAIRAKDGGEGKMKPADFPDRILALETGGGGVSADPLVFATGEFELKSAGELKIAHNLGVVPDIVLYFLCRIDSGAQLSSTDACYSGELAYSTEAMKEGAVRTLYLINGSHFGLADGIFGTSSDKDGLGCVRKANPETFTVGCATANRHCAVGRYRWVTVGNLYEHNERFTVRFYDGEELVKTELVPYGTVVTPPVLQKEGYQLSWYPRDLTIREDTDFHASWELIQPWNTVRFADYKTDEGTYAVEVDGTYYTKPCVQFIQGAAWNGAGNVTQLGESHTVFSIADVVAGKTSVTFTGTVTWTTYSASQNAATDGISVYINWFDQDGKYIDYVMASKSGKFSANSSRFATRTAAIPTGACFMGVVLKFSGYASSATFGVTGAKFAMTVS